MILAVYSYSEVPILRTSTEESQINETRVCFVIGGTVIS